MKIKHAIIVIILAVIATLPLYFFMPLYKAAKSVTKNAQGLNIISFTEDHVEIDLKPKLFAGTGAILPMDKLIKVASYPVYVDMKDRSLIRFFPNTKFKILKVKDTKYAIELISGGFFFKSKSKGDFIGVKTPFGKVTLKGTSGKFLTDSVEILNGKVSIDKDIKLGSKEGYSNKEKVALKFGQIDELRDAVFSLKESELKNLNKNIIENLIAFQRQLDSNKRLEIPSKPGENRLEKWKNFLHDVFTKKIQVYCDMYVLRMAITQERYSNEGLNFPVSLTSLKDEYAKKKTIDPWGMPYEYTADGSNYFNLKSSGLDKTMGTADDIVLFRTGISANASLINLSD